jgi:hypothetical protein
MTLLLKDFDPKPALHAAVHEVPRAKFPVIDMHNHVNDPGGIHGEHIPVDEVIRRMVAANVQKVVFLTGMWGDKLQSLLDEMVKPHSDRFIAEMVAQLDDAVKRGARGLKVLQDLGLGLRDKSGNLVAIDDPRSDPVWEECAANYFRRLETPGRYFPYWGSPGQRRWAIYGLELPDSILEKVYHKNADKIFAQFKGKP